ncbi:MAG: prolyl oligopeptidase family serine peptidase [Planctomycetaceae bacterium]
MLFVQKKDGRHPSVLVVHGGREKLKPSKAAGRLRGMLAREASAASRSIIVSPRRTNFLLRSMTAAARNGFEPTRKTIRSTPQIRHGGYSAGGHLVCLLATTGEAPSDKNGNVDTRLQAVAAGGAPTDFRAFPDDGKWAEYWMGGDLKTVPEKFNAASATAFVDKDDAPVFFFNGTADELVPLEWSKSCHDALKACGVRTELHTIEGAGHIPAAMNSKALDKAYSFLEAELKGTRSP